MDSMDHSLRCKAVEQYFTVVLFFFQFSPVWYSILENLSILELALLLKSERVRFHTLHLTLFTVYVTCFVATRTS